jgi:hypothetical protein
LGACLLDLQPGRQLRQGGLRKRLLNQGKHRPLLQTDVRLELLTDLMERLGPNVAEASCSGLTAARVSDAIGVATGIECDIWGWGKVQ